MAEALNQVARQPAFRLKTTRVREPVRAAQAVSELTLEEACTDPNLLVRRGRGLYFREQVREVVSASYDLPEHHLLAGFLHFLGLQIGDLRRRVLQEIRLREERRPFRSARAEAGTKTWWESEDLPRIEELGRLLEQLEALRGQQLGLLRHAFLPSAPPLRELPPSTPLFRSHRAYAAAYRIIAGHFRAYRVSLDNTGLLTRARSLPVLYEWWCALQVIRVLQNCLKLRDDQPSSSPFRRLLEERTRLVLDFNPDQVLDFEDETGRMVRLRYQPSYRSARGGAIDGYGLLGHEYEMTPDLALEIADPNQPTSPIPELIVVLDAKYTSVPQRDKLDEVKRKYGKIGVFRTGRVLSRQVWALTPSPPAHTTAPTPDWARFCTVDNVGFWTEWYDMSSTVDGAVQARPLLPVYPSPLEALLRSLLQRCGIRLR
jgi:hypothetical protein